MEVTRNNTKGREGEVSLLDQKQYQLADVNGTKVPSDSSYKMWSGELNQRDFSLWFEFSSREEKCKKLQKNRLTPEFIVEGKQGSAVPQVKSGCNEIVYSTSMEPTTSRYRFVTNFR